MVHTPRFIRSILGAVTVAAACLPALSCDRDAPVRPESPASGVAPAVPPPGRPSAAQPDRAAPDAPADEQPVISRDPEDWSPAETVRQVHRMRLGNRTLLLSECIIEQQREDVLALMEAVDRLVDANRELVEAVQEAYGQAQAFRFDRPQFGNVIGVFSAEVRVVDETIHGETAEVTVQVGGRVPLETVQLERLDGRWLIRTDEPVPGLVDQINRMADARKSLREKLRGKGLSADELERDLAFKDGTIRRRMEEAIRTHRADKG